MKSDSLTSRNNSKVAPEHKYRTRNRPIPNGQVYNGYCISTFHSCLLCCPQLVLHGAGCGLEGRGTVGRAAGYISAWNSHRRLVSWWAPPPCFHNRQCMIHCQHDWYTLRWHHTLQRSVHLAFEISWRKRTCPGLLNCFSLASKHKSL